MSLGRPELLGHQFDDLARQEKLEIDHELDQAALARQAQDRPEDADDRQAQEGLILRMLHRIRPGHQG